MSQLTVKDESKTIKISLQAVAGICMAIVFINFPATQAAVTDQLCLEYCKKNCYFDFQGNKFMLCLVAHRSCICTATPPRVGQQPTSAPPNRPTPPTNSQGQPLDSTEKPTDSGLSSEVIIALVIAGVLGPLFLCIICYCCYKMKKRNKDNNENPEMGGYPMNPQAQPQPIYYYNPGQQGMMMAQQGPMMLQQPPQQQNMRIQEGPQPWLMQQNPPPRSVLMSDEPEHLQKKPKKHKEKQPEQEPLPAPLPGPAESMETVEGQRKKSKRSKKPKSEGSDKSKTKPPSQPAGVESQASMNVPSESDASLPPLEAKPKKKHRPRKEKLVPEPED